MMDSPATLPETTNTSLSSVVSQPLFISVIMPVYNVRDYVAAAIESILDQTHDHFQFFIIDDGSTDGSTDVIKSWAAQDRRIIHLFSEHNKGAYFARNLALELAEGDMVAYMDADDIALPDRFQIQLDWMAENRLDVCGACVKKFGGSDGLWWFPETHDAIAREMLFSCAMVYPTVMLRADIARQHLHDGRIRSGGDYELLLRLAPLYRLGNVPQILVRYREHAAQTHVVMNQQFRESMQRAHRPFFFKLFPDATSEDYQAVEKITFRDSWDTLAELEQSGKWLLRLAQTPDQYLHKKMARRWSHICFQSTRLGKGVFALYHRIAEQFNEVEHQNTFLFRLACALRIDTSTKLVRSLLRIRHRVCA